MLFIIIDHRNWNVNILIKCRNW